MFQLLCRKLPAWEVPAKSKGGTFGRRAEDPDQDGTGVYSCTSLRQNPQRQSAGRGIGVAPSLSRVSAGDPGRSKLITFRTHSDRTIRSIPAYEDNEVPTTAAADITCVVGIIAKVSAFEAEQCTIRHFDMNSISTRMHESTRRIEHGDLQLLYRVLRIRDKFSWNGNRRKQQT